MAKFYEITLHDGSTVTIDADKVIDIYPMRTGEWCTRCHGGQIYYSSDYPVARNA